MALDATSNTLVTVDKIAKYLLRYLFIDTIFAQKVTRDFDQDFTGGQGDTAKVRKPASFTSSEFDGGAGITVQNARVTSVDVKVDKLLDISFEYGTAEKRLKMDEFDRLLIRPVMEAHVEKIETLLASLYVGIPHFYGTPGTTPNAKSDILQARKILVDNRVPPKDRCMVLDSACEAEYLDLFSDADKDGSTAALREASLGRRFGLDTYVSQVVQTHTPTGLNAGVGTFQLNGTVAANATTIVIKSSAGTLTGSVKVGDVFTLTLDDGTTQKVSCSTAANAAANIVSVALYQGQEIRSAATAGNAITMLGCTTAGVVTAYTNSLLFHPGAFALAFAPQEKADGAADSMVRQFKGFGLRVIKAWNATYKKTTLSCDLLLGVKCIDNRLGVRLIG